MQSPESRAPNLQAKPTCGKGCTEICDQCSGFELEADWDAGLTEPVAPAAKPLGAGISPPEPRAQDTSWLESRLADIAARLEHTVKSYDPAPALDKFNERLDNFEARVEAVVDRAVAVQDPESLRFIEARVREIDDQFDKMRTQIGRISTIDARVAEIWDHVQLDLPSPTAGLPKLVEGAVSRALAAASVLKAEGAAVESPEVAAFERMEDALNRLIERVEAIEIQSVAPERHAEDPNDDIELINRAYEEGARALGLIMAEAPADSVHTLRALHAADYVPRLDDEPYERKAEPAPAPARDAATMRGVQSDQPAPSAPAMPVAPVMPAAVSPAPVTAVSDPAAAAQDLRESFRASALRAKQRAQAEAEMYARALPAPERFSISGPAASGSLPSLSAGLESRPVSSLFPPPPSAEASKPAAATAKSAGEKSAQDAEAARPRETAVSRAREAVAAAELRAKRPLSQGRWNRGFFLGFAMLLGGGISYLTVDRLLNAPSDQGTRSLGSASRPETVNAPQKPAQQRSLVTATSDRAPPATPAALPPESEPATPADVSAAAARAAALPATIASASLRHAAANGDPAAEFEIGARYSEGRGVSADAAQAFVWYQRSAARGYPAAQFRLGALYERGSGVEKDIERAKIWYRRAGEKGHAKAMHNLAVLLSSGENPDMPQSARWFREAAERNLADSQYNLAMLNEAGQGVPKNLAEAFKWYALAARSGDTEAGKRLEIVRRQMSKGEVAGAEKAVQTWMPVDMLPSPPASVPQRAQP
jgi:localization factor PodJL